MLQHEQLEHQDDVGGLASGTTGRFSLIDSLEQGTKFLPGNNFIEPLQESFLCVELLLSLFSIPEP